MSNRHPHPEQLAHQYEIGVLSEECGEVVQIIGKTLRHGYDSYNPDDKSKRTNLDLIHDEIGDVLGATSFAVERGLLDVTKLENSRIDKLNKLRLIAPLISDGYSPLGDRLGLSGSRQILNEAVSPAAALVTNAPKPKPVVKKPGEHSVVEIVSSILLLTFVCAVMFGLGHHFGQGKGYDNGKRDAGVAVAEAANKCFADRTEAMGLVEVNVGDCEILARLAGIDAPSS